VLAKLLSRYAPLGLLALLLVIAVARLPVAAAEMDAVHVARLSGIVDPVVAQYLIRVIERAEREDAAGLIVLLDTPGGLCRDAPRTGQAVGCAR
jgi:membrane-bound ClpP family serine protease